MTPNPDAELADIERRVLKAANALISHDIYLMTVDANERSITHKFAEHLQLEFREWNVDCEFNRDKHDEPKRLILPRKRNTTIDDLHAKTVFPDIIVHRRGTKENLLVIEVKKLNNPEKDRWDKLKLEAFGKELKYRCTLFFCFNTKGFTWTRV